MNASAASGLRRRFWRSLAWAAAALALAAVFVAYRNPHLVFDLANRLWACF
ncbi:MAG: hypothetical protein IT503_07945 [Burkholderiaceae bacterium]|nr:hypothetical protein [Ideonella sp.]MCC7286101.1 hypothetical protein [Burkholderiaceae bacterium]